MCRINEILDEFEKGVFEKKIRFKVKKIRKRKLRATWTFETTQELRMLYGMDEYDEQY